ncbi:MAG TPA: GTP-binding protein, partial [Steroidobacteraceae bacterium]|nr:GTP-binding protein [Steroidobacteraceae bacterium]
LVNRILSERHGKRIAVIENELGEVGVDHQLVIGAEEEIFETNNGCICCKVRGDLIRILGQLLKRRDRFDYVLIETTGMADPGPVAQTFFLDDDLKGEFLLDAIVTVVDARHVERHLAELQEPREQIAFADVLLLNKADLVAPAELARIERRVRAMNATARIHRTRNADAPLDAVLGVGAFDLGRVLAVDGGFLEPEYPFEWAGVYALDAGTYRLRTGAGEAHDHAHHHHDDDAHAHAADGLAIAVLPARGADEEALASLVEPAVRQFSAEAGSVRCGGTLEPGPALHRIDAGHGSELELHVSRAGQYALFCEHAPEELDLRIEGVAPVTERRFASHHHHDEEIGTVGIVDARALDPQKLDGWFSYLLQSRGQDIFRMKGVLNVRGEERRYVFHGVHMMFDGRLERPWNGAARGNSLVFIGRNLDRAELEAGFESCVA